MEYGIDISHYQGNIDWDKIKATGDIKFVIMKAMYESSKRQDDFFEQNYNGATRIGLNRGVYNYIGNISAIEPEYDAKSLLNILKGRILEYGIWLDVEDEKLKVLGKDAIEQVILREADIFSAAGYNVGIYCNMYWYTNIITDKIKKLFDGRFWIARYPRNDSGIVIDSLNPKEVCKGSIGWQYSSKGKVEGICGNVDMDVFWDSMSKNDNIIEEPNIASIQSLINPVIATAKPHMFDKCIAGKYVTTANLYLRDDAGIFKKPLTLIPKGTTVYNYGYYSIVEGVNWYYIQVEVDCITYTGFSSSEFLRR